MIGVSPRRIYKSRAVRFTLAVLALWSLVEAFFIHRTLVATSHDDHDPPPPPGKSAERIFLASLPWNNEIVLRTHLINQIRDLVHALGVANIYISIYENGSYDGTKGALHDLQVELDQMGVENRVLWNDTTHEQIIADPPTRPTPGWVHVDRPNFDQFGIRSGDYALRRIPYLSELRNMVLLPLEEQARRGRRFDKILFLNDVVYTAADVVRLLRTRGGEYAAACTLDFESPPAFYDTFALRDSDGHPALMSTWPFFRSAASRDALIRNKPVPVRSCWNGLVVMDAEPFYTSSPSSFSPQGPLRFRGIEDSLAQRHVEGSECCLVHADNPLSTDAGKGVWINPLVRVGYCHPDLHRNVLPFDWALFKQVCQMAYDAVHTGPRGGSWVGYFRVAAGMFENRLRRATLALGAGRPDNWSARRKLAAWQHEDPGRAEVGDFCLIDEMQVIEPHGWMHV